jgi:hypothetical protein
VRALEWERRDLLRSARDADRLQQRYAAFLFEEGRPPAAQTVEAPPATASVQRPRAVWIPVLAGLAPALIFGLAYLLGGVAGNAAGADGRDDFPSGNLRLLALALVIVSSLLLVGAVLPPGVVARGRISPGSFARYRQPLALAAIGILAPVTLFALLAALM